MITLIENFEMWYNSIYTKICMMDKSYLLKLALKISELYNNSDLSNELKYRLASLQRYIMKVYLSKVVNSDNIDSVLSKEKLNKYSNHHLESVRIGIRKLRSIDINKIRSFILSKYVDFKLFPNVLYIGIRPKIHNFSIYLDCSVIQFKTTIQRYKSICAKRLKSLRSKLTISDYSKLRLKIALKKTRKNLKLRLLMNWLIISNKIKLNR